MNYDKSKINEIINMSSKEFREKYKGNKTEYLINIPPELINSLSKENLYKLTKSLSIISSSRKKRIMDFMVDNPELPTANIFREGHKISYMDEKLSPNKELSIQKLRNLYLKQRNFLTAKSSTIKGFTEILDDFYKRISKGMKEVNKIVGYEENEVRVLNKEDYKKLWQLYNEVKDRYTGSGFDSNQIQSMVYEIVEEYGEHNDLNGLLQILEETYTPEYIYEQKKLLEIEDDENAFSTNLGR